MILFVPVIDDNSLYRHLLIVKYYSSFGLDLDIKVVKSNIIREILDEQRHELKRINYLHEHFD